MPSYTLKYFNVKARAEPSRYMFAIAGVNYTDERISSDEWKKLKPTLPLGQLPILEVDGKQIAQSHAIHRFVASELGLYGANSLERADVDVVLETARDVAPHIGKIFGEKDEKAKNELKDKLRNETLPGILTLLEKLLNKNNGGTGWFVGNKISIADVMVYNMLVDFLPAVLGGPIDLSKHQNIKGVVDRFQADPKVAEWIKKRPASNM